MLNDVLEFSRDSTALDVKEHVPQEIITSALGDALRNHAGSDVKIEYDFKHIHSLKVDGCRIIRVLTNIIDNALDAMVKEPDGKSAGNLKISTLEYKRDDKYFISITVADSGPGIPKEALDKIFDPFFTQGKKGGTGLGLAICQRVVNLHGGKITARNTTSGKLVEANGSPTNAFGDDIHYGAEFVIELPMGISGALGTDAELIYHSNELQKFREEEAVRIDYGDTANTAEFMRINKERGRQSFLLMVDDEPLFRESVRCLFNNLGQVKDHVKFVEVDSAENALQLLDVREFDYVIADIDLGRRRMNGYDFTQKILKEYPNTRVLIHSNKRKEEMDKDVREIKSDKFMGFLPKPMKASELLQFLACKTFDPPATRAFGSEASRAGPLKKILIVNDDDALLVGLRFQIKAAAGGNNVQVLEAGGVSDALLTLAKNSVDIILSDINMGQGKPDGYELLKTVKKEGNPAKVYMISGYPKSDEEPKAKSLGAEGYLQLPVNNQNLKEIL